MPDEAANQLPPTLDASNAKIVVISLVGSKALKVTRSFEQANDANSTYGANTSSRAYNESPHCTQCGVCDCTGQTQGAGKAGTDGSSIR